MNIEPMYLTILLIAGGIILLVLFFHYVPFFLWLSAKVSGVNISLVQLFLMRIRNVPPYIIVPGMIEAHKAGLKNITRDELEAHYLAGGHVEKVVHALVSASKANIELPFQMATAIDLAGRDVFEAVQMSVNPKVIDTPPVTAVAKDGIQLIAKARVTVRANIRQLVGGAGEDTILARVGEGIVSSIGSSENLKGTDFYTINDRIGLNITPASHPTNVQKGLYFMDVINSKNAQENDARLMLDLDGNLTKIVPADQGKMDFEHMPAAKWYVDVEPTDFGGYPDIYNQETGEILNNYAYKVMDKDGKTIVSITYWYQGRQIDNEYVLVPAT